MKTTLQSLLTALVVAAVLLSGASSITSCSKKDDPTPTTSTTGNSTTTSINTYTATLLYAPIAAGNSNTFYSTSSNTVYTLATASTSSASVDFGYFYGASSLTAQFHSPDNYTTSAYDLSSWTTKNATRFKNTVITSSTFSTYSTTSSLATAYTNGSVPTQLASEASGSRVSVVAGNVYAFVTGAGKYGILKINTINPGTTATANINFDVAVQK